MLYVCGSCFSPLFLDFRAGFSDTIRPRGLEGKIADLSSDLNDSYRTELIRVRDHLCVQDTVDGGVSVMIRHLYSGTTLPSWEGVQYQSEEIDSSWPTGMASNNIDAQPDCDTITVQCHCGGVRFALNCHDVRGRYDGELPDFINPETNKPLVTICACNSCRLACGAFPVYWVSFLLKDVFAQAGSEALVASNCFPPSTMDLKSSTGYSNHGISRSSFWDAGDVS